MISSQLMDEATLSQWTVGELAVTDEVFEQALERVLELNDAGCFGGEEALEASMYDDAFNQYYTGAAAMLISGDLGTAERGFEAISATTVMPLPQVPGSAHQSSIEAGAAAGWSVAGWTQSPEAAVAFVNFLAGPEAQQILWEQAGVVPNLEGLELEAKDAVQEAYLPLIENADDHSTFPSFSASALDAIRTGAPALVDGTLKPGKLLEQAAAASGSGSAG